MGMSIRPNHYTNDPKNPTDLLGRPIAVGDLVAAAVMSYKASSMLVGKIEKINFKRRDPTQKYGRSFIPCPQQQAEKYTLVIEVFQTSAYRRDQRTATLQNVDNLVKLETPGWGMIDNLVTRA